MTRPLQYEGGVLEMFLTESQKHYYTAMKKLGRKKPRKMIRRPMNPYLALFYDIAMSRRQVHTVVHTYNRHSSLVARYKLAAV